jgi:hypothetical protein
VGQYRHEFVLSGISLSQLLEGAFQLRLALPEFAGSLRDKLLGNTLRTSLLDGRSGQEKSRHCGDDAEGLDYQLCLREGQVINERPDTLSRHTIPQALARKPS